MGAVQTRDPAAIDELFTGLRALAFSREGPDGEMTTEKLHQFEVRYFLALYAKGRKGVRRMRQVTRRCVFDLQVVVLANLNPSTTEAARALVPSISRFSDDEIAECLSLLRRSSTKFTPGAAF